MAEAKKDANGVNAIIGVSSADGFTPIRIWVDPVTHRMLVNMTGTGTIGGSDTQVQFNDGGSFGGDAGFTYNKTTDSATLVGSLQAASIKFTDSASNNTITLATASDEAADRTLTIPALGGNKTLAVIDKAQSFSFLQTFTTGVYASNGGVKIGTHTVVSPWFDIYAGTDTDPLAYI